MHFDRGLINADHWHFAASNGRLDQWLRHVRVVHTGDVLGGYAESFGVGSLVDPGLNPFGRAVTLQRIIVDQQLLKWQIIEQSAQQNSNLIMLQVDLLEQWCMPEAFVFDLLQSTILNCSKEF